jgi:hypothetical protein
MFRVEVKAGAGGVGGVAGVSVATGMDCADAYPRKHKASEILTIISLF